MNNQQLITHLRTQLGPQWQIVAHLNVLTVISPLLNEIGDNFEVEIEWIHDHYEIDDNCESLNEFELYNLPKTNAYQYLKLNQIRPNTKDEALVLISDFDHLIHTIYQLMQIQIGLNTIQQLTSQQLHRK